MTHEQNHDTTITSADDPRVTAYALGELDGADIALVEAFLDGDPAAQREVDEIRAFAGVLTDELVGESAPALDDSRRAVLEAALVGGPASDAAASEPTRRATPVLRMLWPLLAAATVLVIVQLGDRGLTSDSMAPEGAAPATQRPVAELRRDDRRTGEVLPDSSALGTGSKAGGLGLLDGADVEGSVAARDSSSSRMQMPGKSLEELGYLDDGRDHMARGFVASASDDALHSLGYAGAGKDADDAPSRARSAGRSSGSDLGIQFEAPADDAVAGEASNWSFDVDGEAAGAVALDESALRELAALGYLGAAADEDAYLEAYELSAETPVLTAPGQQPSVGLVTTSEPSVARYSPSLTRLAPAESDGEALHDTFDSGYAPRAAGSPTPATATADEGVLLRATEALPPGSGGQFYRANGMTGEADAADVEAAAQALRMRVDGSAVDPDRAEERLIPRVHGLDLPRNSKYPTANRGQGETYAPVHENEFVVLSAQNPMAALSTFGVDVDPASYANVRRFLHRNELPPPNAVRLEELVNAFRYDDPAPEGDVPPFAANVSITEAPWAPAHRLVRIGLKGRDVERTARPSSNLVFLLDVSGSMSDADKLPLLINSLKLLLRQLDERDTISIVTYASGSHVVLPPTGADQQAVIEAALDGLKADGSTHASAGIQLAYEQATAAFLPEGNNRILLATDGDFNVGLTSDGDLLRMIQEKARSKVFLTVLGFGTGNLKDSKAELLADNGNGQYAYIDSLDEAHRVLVEELTGTLLTIAKDVKLQVEFNPAKVGAYRLLGYENRKLAAQEFRDDAKDAGEIGAGHTVVAYYEVVPAGVVLPGNVTLKYQQVADVAPAAEVVESPELLTVNLRWKAPDADVAQEFAVPATDTGAVFAEASDDVRFGAAVAMFGMLLRRSEYAGSASMGDVIAWAEAARGEDEDGRRAEFVRLARTAQGLLGVR